MGDMEADIRTHHIHIVKWNGTEWKNYIHFRDYLNANENVALQYEKLKEELESKYADDRQTEYDKQNFRTMKEERPMMHRS